METGQLAEVMEAPEPDRQLCGWRVRTDVALPELLPWTGDAAHPPDIQIRLAPLPGSPQDDADVTVDGEGALLLHIPGLVRLRVEGGHTIQLHVLNPGTADWRLFLLGSGIGYLCHQRGLFPLHAACLDLGGRAQGGAALAIAGPSGAGKSTLATALARRGHILLSDDIAVLEVTGQGAVVRPTFPRLKLWAQSLDAFDMTSAGLQPVRTGLEKFDLSAGLTFDPAPRPLGAIVLLETAETCALEPVAQVAAVPLLSSQVFRP
ncbi:MAG: hypothetical protein B7Z52_07060, partial [Burkholderiales bacterium 12-64-5]